MMVATVQQLQQLSDEELRVLMRVMEKKTGATIEEERQGAHRKPRLVEHVH
jgi:hypothetical protein